MYEVRGLLWCLLENMVLSCLHPWPIWLQLNHAPLNPSIHCLHEFLWPLLDLEAERRVGLELIRMGTHTVKAQTFPRSSFYFPLANCPFWNVQRYVMESPDKSLVRMTLGSVLLVCQLIFHSVSFLLLNKKSAINKMYFCNFCVYIWYISTNGQL